MIWFFERPGGRLQAEIRLSLSGHGYELVWTNGDGQRRVEFSLDPTALLQRRRELEEYLRLDGWIRPGRVTPPRVTRSIRTRKTDVRLH